MEKMKTEMKIISVINVRLALSSIIILKGMIRNKQGNESIIRNVTPLLHLRLAR